MSDEPVLIDCETHGPGRYSATVCQHQLSDARSVGFVENSNDPRDQQAWCADCESVFLVEGGMTEPFLDYCRFAVVCGDCYGQIKERHSQA